MKVTKLAHNGHTIVVTVVNATREPLTLPECTDVALKAAQEKGYNIGGCMGEPFVLPLNAATGQVATESDILDPSFRNGGWQAEVKFAEKFI
jgi:hypothetical protein